MTASFPAALISFAAVGPAVGALVLCLSPHGLPQVPVAGERGEQRRKILASSPWFRAVEPTIRAVAGAVAWIRAVAVREALNRRLGLAGSPFGLDADELAACMILASALAAVGGGAISSTVVGAFGAGAVLGGIMGAALPWFKLDERIKRRARVVCRSLPQAIDLVALAMQAGLDFPGAVGQVAQRMPKDNPLRFELEHLLQKLSIGHSRHAALEGLAARVPALPVRQFVASVTQAERQGTPLARVLGVQARVMRIRRSQAAEQAAARAAILILGPLMLIFACVFVVLLGPFAIKAMRGEMF